MLVATFTTFTFLRGRRVEKTFTTFTFLRLDRALTGKTFPTFPTFPAR